MARKNPYTIELIPILEDLRKLLEIKKEGDGAMNKIRT